MTFLGLNQLPTFIMFPVAELIDYKILFSNTIQSCECTILDLRWENTTQGLPSVILWRSLLWKTDYDLVRKLPRTFHRHHGPFTVNQCLLQPTTKICPCFW